MIMQIKSFSGATARDVATIVNEWLKEKGPSIEIHSFNSIEFARTIVHTFLYKDSKP